MRTIATGAAARTAAYSGRKAAISKTLWKLALTIMVAFFGLLMLMPFGWMISSSLKKPIEVFAFPIQWIPQDVQWHNYKTVWLNEYYPFYRFYVNSLKVGALSIAGTLFVSATSAYAFARVNFPGKNVIFLAYLATLMVPQHITLVPRFVLFHWLGIYNTHWALVLPNVFNVLGIFLLRQFFMGIPRELSEAAYMDGAGHFRIFWRVILPLSKPGFVSLLILSFVWNWNNYLDPLIFLTDKSLYTIPVGLQALLDEEGTQYNLVMAGATCAVLPLMIVFLMFQKYFIQGIATSGLKG
jgi:multiple sugar transport system permease protein